MISVCILAIGDELLNGSTLDSNSQWIKESLSIFDVDVVKSVNIPDDKLSIINELDSYVRLNCDIVIISGGLGPTHDDITKESLSSFFSLPLTVDLNHHKFLSDKMKNKVKDISNIKTMIKSQSEVLETFNGIENKHGTALGMFGEVHGIKFFILPGVPKELKQMINDFMIPNYFKLPTQRTIRVFKTTGITESKLYSKLKNIISVHSKIMKLSFLPHFTGVNIRISIIGDNHISNKIISELKQILGNHCYGEGEESLSSVVSDLLIDSNIRLSIAESCTGGLLSKSLTDFMGSSGYMIGGVVAYSNKIKNKILNISNNILEDDGAVSHRVAELMSENVKKIFETDMGVSITGISGPSGGTEKKPVGLYYISVCYNNRTITKEFLFNVNDRGVHREVACATALNLMRLSIKELI